MGSGCKQNYREDNCTNPVSDKCVFYTGERIEELDICTGDTLEEVTQVLIGRLLAHSQGLDIHLSEIEFNCEFVQNTIAQQDPSLYNLIQQLYNQDCQLKDLIQEVKDSLEPPFAFNTSCLTVPEQPSRNEIIQAAITKLCSLDTTVQQIIADLSTEEEPGEDNTNSILTSVYNIVGNMLATNISSCQKNIQVTGEGQNTQLKFIGQPPIGTILFGNYNVSSFDNSGRGLEAAGMCGWAIANGQNGTTDMRGFTPAMATNVPGPALNSAVQANGDMDLQTNIGDVKGKYKITLASSQIPNHQHTVTQTPHSHSVAVQRSGNGGGGSDAAYNSNFGNSYTLVTSGANANITIGNVTGTTGQPHENRPPTKYLMFIQRIF